MTEADREEEGKERKVRRLRTVGDLRNERLEAALSELDQLVQYQEISGASDDEGEVALRMARASLDTAWDAFRDDRHQVAWAHCHQAYRFVLQSLPPDQREARRKALRREADEKLSNWRRGAVLDILDVEGGIDPESLALAQFILDHHFARVYFDLNAAAIRFESLRWVLIPAVVVLLGISFLLDPAGSQSFLYEPATLGVVMLAGGIGALLSGTLSHIGVGGGIPDFLSAAAGWTVRPFIGAISAVLVCTVLQGGLLPLQGETDVSLYAWAVAAGFADQLVNIMLRRIEASART